jgi:hypothetical protein
MWTCESLAEERLPTSLFDDKGTMPITIIKAAHDEEQKHGIE